VNGVDLTFHIDAGGWNSNVKLALVFTQQGRGIMMTTTDHLEFSARVDQLGNEIARRRADLENSGETPPEMNERLTSLSRKHEEIRRTLNASHNAGSDIIKGLEMDLETLSNKFAEWFADADNRDIGATGPKRGA
jgi:hypothetical protein